MDRVRIGLIGCGLFGESHLQAFRAVRSAEIAAVFDTDTDRAQRIAQEFSIPQICHSVEEICKLSGLHAIDVVTPEALGVDLTPRLTTVKVEEPPKRKAGVQVKSVEELVLKLKNEAKAIS